MTITSLTYSPPVKHAPRSIARDYQLLDQAVELTGEGRHAESLGKVLAHLFPDLELPDLATRPLTFVQGSSRVSVKLAGDHLEVSVPLATLPTGGGAIAAMRYVLTKLSANGQLHQPRLHGDDLYLEFRDPISRLHPAKLLEVLRRMPMQADTSDDWLIGQFGAKPLARAELGALDDDELARCQAIWQAHWRDVEELAKESQRKRSLFFLNEITAYALHHLSYTLPLSGFVGSRLAEAAATFNDNDENPDTREAALGKCIKDMKAVTADQLRADLGHASYALSPVADGSGQVLAEYFTGDYIDTIDGYHKTDKSIDAAVALVGTFTFLLARYTWPDEVAGALQAGLVAASGKPWREASDVLLHHAREIAESYGEDEASDADDGDDEDGEAVEGGE